MRTDEHSTFLPRSYSDHQMILYGSLTSGWSATRPQWCSCVLVRESDEFSQRDWKTV